MQYVAIERKSFSECENEILIFFSRREILLRDYNFSRLKNIGIDGLPNERPPTSRDVFLCFAEVSSRGKRFGM